MNNAICMSEEQLMEFLRDKDTRELCYCWRDYIVLLIKSAYDADTEFLYSTYQYKAKDPRRVGDDAKYMGIYSRVLDKVIGSVEGIDHSYTTNPETVLTDFEADVAARICQIVDGKPVPVTVKSKTIRDDQEYFLQHGASSEAIGLFYGDNHPPVYKPYFKIESPSTDTFASILHRHDESVQHFAEQFILENANGINNRLWQIDIVTAKLNELNATPGEHHIRRRIASCINPKAMKTVAIEIDKNGKQLTGKIDAYELTRANDCYYSIYRMDAPTRRAFEQEFGRNSELLASDIARISYGRKTLYTKDSDEQHAQAASSGTDALYEHVYLPASHDICFYCLRDEIRTMLDRCENECSRYYSCDKVAEINDELKEIEGE